MKVTQITRDILACRREARTMLSQGWEKVGQSGGRLWELTSGGRTGHRIVDVKIAADGISLWIRTQKAA